MAEIPKCPNCDGDIRIEVEAAVAYTPVRIEPGGILVARREDGANELDGFILYCSDCSEEFHLEDFGLADWQDEITWSMRMDLLEVDRARRQAVAATVVEARPLDC